MVIKRIKAIIGGLLETYGVKDLYELLNSLEITIIKKELSVGKKARFYRDVFGNEYIFIVPGLNQIEERYILAHELGHALLHGHISNEFYFSSYINKGRLEYEADCFAAELLIDESNLEKQYIEDMSIDQLTSYFGVSRKLIEYKFNRF
jgi:Zn-dependent peptidase ImmA (M78 family)